jgi:hypothetical protein
MANSKVIVVYDKTNYGRVYLGDVGQRHQLGGGKGLYTMGQDRYMSYGQDATFVQTGEVLMSANYGTINMMKTDRTGFTVTYA